MRGEAVLTTRCSGAPFQLGVAAEPWRHSTLGDAPPSVHQRANRAASNPATARRLSADFRYVRATCVRGLGRQVLAAPVRQPR